MPLNNKHILPDGFTVTSHTGAFGTRANSILSVKTAVERDSDIVEFDVSFRPDGTAVIIHNPSPSQRQGVLLKKALEEVVKSKNCKINLDIKSTANLPEIDKLVNHYGLEERVFYTGVFEDWVETVRKNSAISYFINYNPSSEEGSDEKYVDCIIQKAIELGAIGINSDFRGVSDMMVKKIHENGLLVSLWTANRKKDMLKALSLSPDNITTKKPDKLKMLIK